MIDSRAARHQRVEVLDWLRLCWANALRQHQQAAILTPEGHHLIIWSVDLADWVTAGARRDYMSTPSDSAAFSGVRSCRGSGGRLNPLKEKSVTNSLAAYAKGLAILDSPTLAHARTYEGRCTIDVLETYGDLVLLLRAKGAPIAESGEVLDGWEMATGGRCPVTGTAYTFAWRKADAEGE